KDWMLTWKGSPTAELNAYERTIIDGLFTGRQQVALSTLRGTFRPTLTVAESQMYGDAMTRKLFASNPQQSRAAWGCLGIAVVLIGIAAAGFLGLNFGWGLIGVAVVLTGIALTLNYPLMPKRTAAGRDLLRHTL